MRVAEGAYAKKKDKNGAEYHLHRLDGTAPRTAPAPPLPPSGPVAERADADTLHTVYSALLARLQLSEAHREALRQRGLTDDEIDRRDYRTLAVQGRAALARALRERFGDKLLSVPGIIVKQGEHGPYVTIAGAAGLLVPIRDTAGRVVALKVRRDDGGNGPRYTYVSSTPHGGPGPGSPVHVPRGVTSPCQCVRITEGELKADVATVRSGLPTVSIPGAGNWQPALPVLRELGARTVRLALDMDAADKPAVARGLAALAEALTVEALAVELERWDPRLKGIDDALAAGAAVEVLTGDAARQAIAGTLAEATAGEPIPEPGPLDRLDTVLANGGAAALFADRPLLAALAALADAEPAAFAARRAALKGRVSLPDLNSALAPLRRERARQLPPVLLAEAGYRVEAGRLCRTRGTPDGGTALVPLCNFTARIVEAVTRDDGAEQSAVFTLAGTRDDGRELVPATVPAADFSGLGWVTTAWHGEAVVYAGQGTRDHLRAAIELLSAGRVRRTEYTHTGWRKIGAVWHYLHGGAIGPDGATAQVAVELNGPLAGYVLPAPPTGADLAAAVLRFAGDPRRPGARPHHVPALGGRLPGRPRRGARTYRPVPLPGRLPRDGQERTGGPGSAAFRRRAGLRGTCPATGYRRRTRRRGWRSPRRMRS